MFSVHDCPKADIGDLIIWNMVTGDSPVVSRLPASRCARSNTLRRREDDYFMRIIKLELNKTKSFHASHKIWICQFWQFHGRKDGSSSLSSLSVKRTTQKSNVSVPPRKKNKQMKRIFPQNSFVSNNWLQIIISLCRRCCSNCQTSLNVRNWVHPSVCLSVSSTLLSARLPLPPDDLP